MPLAMEPVHLANYQVLINLCTACTGSFICGSVLHTDKVNILVQEQSLVIESDGDAMSKT